MPQINLPADLPENWTPGQIVAPTGQEAGLSTQHGYNYLMKQVNAAQQALNNLDASQMTYGKSDLQTIGDALDHVVEAVDSLKENLEELENTPATSPDADGIDQTAITGPDGESLSIDEALAVLAGRIGTEGNVGEELEEIRVDLSDMGSTLQSSIDSALQAVNDSRPTVFTVMLTADGWGDTAPRTQTVEVPGLPESKCIIDVIQSGDEDLANIELRERQRIRLINTGVGEITAVCFKNRGAPAVDLNLEILSVQGGEGGGGIVMQYSDADFSDEPPEDKSKMWTTREGTIIF